MKWMDFLRFLFFEGWTTKTKENVPVDVSIDEPLPQSHHVDVPAPDFSPVDSLSEEHEEMNNATSIESQKNEPDPYSQVVYDDTDPTEAVVEEAERSIPSALLDNGAFMSLASKLSDLYKEIELIGSESSSDEVREVIRIVEDRIVEGLIASGADPIASEEFFNISRHDPVPKAIVRKGTPIEATLSPGISVGDKVLIKAKVTLKK